MWGTLRAGESTPSHNGALAVTAHLPVRIGIGLVGGRDHLVALDNDGPSLERRDAVQAPRLDSSTPRTGAARPKVQRANVRLGGEGAVPVVGYGDDASRGTGGPGANESGSTSLAGGVGRHGGSLPPLLGVHGGGPTSTISDWRLVPGHR